LALQLSSLSSLGSLPFFLYNILKRLENVKKININNYSIDNINPVYFKFKDTQKENFGVIAHELQQHYPFLVEGVKDGDTLQSVNYVGLIPVLIKEIQELKREIKTIKEELNKK
jgi:hypothetical protein